MKTAITFIAFTFIASPAAAFTERGEASVYGNGDGWEWKCVAQQKPTGGCEIMDPDQMTAAHQTLPLGTIIKVTNLRNGRVAFVMINDRGPYKRQRILDMSPMVEKRLACGGLCPVEISIAVLAGGGSL